MQENEITITVQELNKLKALAVQTIEMRADIRAVIAVFTNAMQAFGLTDLSIKNKEGGIQSMLPELVGKLTMKMASGTFDTQALANIESVIPVLEKYKYLVENGK